jgi:glycosyltransferase involved in cell wall biosynthesis
VTDYAALKETVLYGKKVNTDITSRRGKEEYTDVLISALKDEKWQNEERKRMMKECKNKFKWSDIAKEWKKLFSEDV